MNNILLNDAEILLTTMEMFGQWDNVDYSIHPGISGDLEWYYELNDCSEFKLGETSLN